ncbi:MAG TPA: cysteine desulfurase [Flavobacteriaceae bacterium]|nr:cysteine desulfurase [Flavobacteriaceae bacterium]
MALDIQKIRADFPILNRKVNGSKLVYLDNAATSQTPTSVINSIKEYYLKYNANIHRGVHSLSQEATDAYEQARKKVQSFFNAKNDYEIIFTSGATESINLVASSFTSLVKPGDEILITHMEHHSNIVPWQLLCERTAAKLVVLPIDSNGELQIDKLDDYLSEKTKLVAVTHISNGLGVINPIKEIIDKAHAVNAAVLIDGAQACSHLKPDVQALDVDFYVASAHKMCGPTGVGVLYGKEEWLHKLPPYQGGGEMIKEVTFGKTTYADLPHKFEAGTPNICGGIAFGAALDYVNNIGYDAIAKHEKELLDLATKELRKIDGLHIYGDVANKTSLISFNIEGLHPYDIGTILDQMGIAVRTGHHCNQPIMDFFNIPGTVRASFAFYNTTEEVEALVKAVKKAKNMLS